MKVRMEKLIKHLKTQLAVAQSLDSDWVYITRNEAKKCLELAEAEIELIESFDKKEDKNETHMA